MEKNNDSTGKWTVKQTLPLHLAAICRAPANVVRMLLDAYPAGAKEKNEYGRLPLHCAAAHNAPADVVRILAEACPEAKNIMDNYGELPVHIAKEENVPKEIIKLLDVHDGTTNTGNDTNKYANADIDHLIRNEKWSEVKACLSAYPGKAREKDYRGYLSLHYAACFKAPADVVRILLGAYPEGKKVKDINGKLPVHIAKDFGAPKDVIKLLDVP